MSHLLPTSVYHRSAKIPKSIIDGRQFRCSISKRMSLKRIAKPGIETSAALIGTAFSAMLLVLTAMHAGPLWRDETNTFNLAHMPSLRDIWHNLQFESFPLLWPLLVRGCGMLGLTDSDMGIRIFGLGIGLFFLSLAVAVPALDWGTHAYLEYRVAGRFARVHFYRRSESRLRSGGLPAGVEFRQNLAGPGVSDQVADHFSWFYLPAVRPMRLFRRHLSRGNASCWSLVAIRRQQWKTLWAMAGIGLVATASLFIYLPIIHRDSEYLPLVRSPSFNASKPLGRTRRRSGRPE